MHILISPNAFKNSCSAEAAAAAIAQGLMQSRLDCTCECFPVADGGDGTADLIIQKCGGKWIETTVKDPLNRNIPAGFGLIDNGKTAIIEMAAASGIHLLKGGEPDPLKALSYGTGQQLQAALNMGAGKIILGMGGSATVDGGTGILQAMGIRFLDASGAVLDGLPGSLGQLASVDLSVMDKRILQTELVILCDVNNCLLGSNGAAAMFGPQKGASPAAVEILDKGLARLSQIAGQATGHDMATAKYGGTAGGAAAGLWAFCNAKLVNGIGYFLWLTNYEVALGKAQLVITGEGSIDEQTLQGKGPFGVASLARQKNIPVIALAGTVPLETNNLLQQYFDILMPIGNGPTGLPEAMAATEKNLLRTAIALGNMLAFKNG